MVQYHEFVRLVRREASRQGADLSDFEENSDVISVAADIWNDRKEELQNASEREAAAVAEEEVTVA